MCVSPDTADYFLTEPLLTAAMQEPPPAKSYWRFSKNDFYPEPTFQNFQTYISAVSDTPRRLKDRLLSRSSDATELVEMKKQSENPMHRCLTWWDLIWLAFGEVVGSGIFSITGQETHDNAGPAIVLSYAISGFSALLSVFCYTEFSVDIPTAGGSFSFLRIELGDFIAYIAAGNILLEAVVGAAGLGRSWSSYFASMISSNPNILRIKIESFAEGFNLLDPLAVAVLLICNGIAISGSRRTSTLVWITSLLSACIIVFIIVVGFVHADTANLVPFVPFGAKGVFAASAVVYWSYTGFDFVATMAEETRNPSKDIPIGLVGSMSMITVVYCLMSLALAMMVKYTEVDVNAAYSVAFEKIGMNWAKYLVGVCALKGMTTSLLVLSMGQARYTTQIARSHMIPPWFALVHPKTGTPIYATLLVAILSCVVALFSSLDVLASVFSFSTLFIFMLMAVALLVRRYCVRDVTPPGDHYKFLASLFVIFGSSVGLAVVFHLDKGGLVGYIVTSILWFLGTLGIALLPKRRFPKAWGVPLVPWFPSVSILINIFLIGSLGVVAFWRFFICSGVMVLYYLLVGVHTTYDVAHADPPEVKVEEGKQVKDQEIS